jgi:anionic cell wall polymer biosynthesis LytR-Cps2A-Psr (LCP) family protein
VDPSIGMGQITLMGDQSIHYVRTRKDVGDQLNLSRIQRQQTYLDGFVAAFREKQKTETEFIIAAYEQVQPYLVTDCSANAISGMVDRFSGFQVTEVVTPEGRNELGEEYYEFYVDEQKLDELILRLFYAPK